MLVTPIMFLCSYVHMWEAKRELQTGGATLPRDSGSPPTITFEKMAGRRVCWT
jgi:hypothetical protein